MKKRLDKRGKIISFSFLVIGLFVLLYFIFFIPNVKSNPDTGITNCTNLTVAGETYFLSNDILNNQITYNCINISAQNITFDCQGHYISSIQNYTGIYSNQRNTTIKNCNISMLGGDSVVSGILFSSANYSNLINNNVSGSGYGIVISSGINYTLINNTGIGVTVYYGIYLSRSLNNLLTNNIAISNSNHGMWLYATNNTLLINNLGASFRSGYGFYLSGVCSNDVLINNTGIGNASSGILIESSKNILLTNNTGVSNSSGGVVVSSSSNINLTLNRGISDTNYAISISSSNNSVLINNTGMSNTSNAIYVSLSNSSILTSNVGINYLNGTEHYGIYLYKSNNSILINNTGKSNNTIAIAVVAAYNNTLINNTAIRLGGLTSPIPGDMCGATLYITSCSNNTLINNIVISNSSSKICLSYAPNNFLSASVLSGNYTYSHGIYMEFTNNTIIANTTSSNNFNGIYLWTSSNNTLTGLITNNNSMYGILISGPSYYNTIKDSFIQFNNLSGLILNSSFSSPQYNSFYNNYFNNSAQYINASTTSVNYFNTTKTLGTNIVGGDYLGGNYWAALNGTGFSQTCTSSTDGICDTAYSLEGVNYDYLPLACIESWSCGAWQICQSSSTQTRTCTDANLCQTYKSKPTESQACTYPGGGLPQTTTETQIISTITSGQSSSVSITNPNINIRNITINTNTNVSNASITVSKKENETLPLTFPSGVIYQAFTIATTVNNNNLNNVTMEFRVNRTWLDQQNYSYNDVALYRIPEQDSLWQALTTVSIREDGDYYYFYALSPGFSTFIIFIGLVECTPAEVRCFNNELQSCAVNKIWTLKEQCKYGCENGKCVNAIFNVKINSEILYNGIILGVIIAIITVFFLLIKKISKKKIRKKN